MVTKLLQGKSFDKTLWKIDLFLETSFLPLLTNYSQRNYKILNIAARSTYLFTLYFEFLLFCLISSIKTDLNSKSPYIYLGLITMNLFDISDLYNVFSKESKILLISFPLCKNS